MLRNTRLLIPLICLGLLLSGCIGPATETQAAADFRPTLIIDPGHGGADGGAVGLYGQKESTLNLDIGLRLHELCKLYGIPHILTRDSETLTYPEEAESIAAKKKFDQNQRLRLIRDCPDGILFSIHQNYYPSPEVSGIQVFYGHRAGDRALGEHIQQLLLSSLHPEQKRVTAEIDESIYLMRECDCTSILIECGFISGREDIARLQQESYRMQLAAVLAAGYMTYIEAKN